MDGLIGCPYSLPDDMDVMAQVDTLLATESRIRARIASAAQKLKDAGALRQTLSGQRAREIYESNSIEGLGPSLPATVSILDRPEAQRIRESVGTLHDEMFIRSVQSDSHLVDVLTLHGAKILAEDLLSSWQSGTPLSEVDIRSMHDLICAGESFAGRYKRYHVTISGEGGHEPVLPIDTPDAMRAYTAWLANSDGALPPTLRAAIAHAWLTHIHPFEDGNGRLARIIANLILAKCELPPAIIVHKSQRDGYIDALSHSDSGGDIMPLTGLFIKTMRRFAIDIEKPQHLRRILRDEISREKSGAFSRWTAAFNEFITRLTGELSVRKIRIVELSQMESESFGLLAEQDATGAKWLLRLYMDEIELLVWIGYSDARINSHIDSPIRYPALFFSVRNDSYSLKPYRPARPNEVGGLTQVCVIPEVTAQQVFIVADDRVRSGGMSDAAAEVASRIRHGFEARRTTVA